MTTLRRAVLITAAKWIRRHVSFNARLHAEAVNEGWG